LSQGHLQLQRLVMSRSDVDGNGVNDLWETGGANYQAKYGERKRPFETYDVTEFARPVRPRPEPYGPIFTTDDLQAALTDQINQQLNDFIAAPIPTIENDSFAGLFDYASPPPLGQTLGIEELAGLFDFKPISPSPLPSPDPYGSPTPSWLDALSNIMDISHTYTPSNAGTPMSTSSWASAPPESMDWSYNDYGINLDGIDPILPGYDASNESSSFPWLKTMLGVGTYKIEILLKWLLVYLVLLHGL